MNFLTGTIRITIQQSLMKGKNVILRKCEFRKGDARYLPIEFVGRKMNWN
jgi:hypothetical protein